MLHVTPGASFTLADYRGQLGPVREYEGFTIAFYSAPPPSCTSRGTLLYRTREFAFVPVTDRVPGGAIVGIVTHNVDPSVSGLVCPTGCFPPARTPVVTASGLPSTFTYTETLTPGAPNCCVVSVVQTSQGKGQGQGKAASVVTLAWGDPLRFGGVGPITSYNIYRGTVEGAETLLVSLPVDQITVTESGMYSYTDKAVTPGHMYFYQLAAVNSYGEGDRTYEVRITA
jgi:hypothetical protein